MSASRSNANMMNADLNIENPEEGSFQDFINLLSDQELEECLRLLLPIIKLDAGKYLIGTKVMKILVRNNHLLARVGGGFMDLNQAINSEAKI